MPETLETERTLIRPFESADADAAHVWFSDPGVMRFIPAGGDATLDDTRRRIAAYIAHQEKWGFSKGIVIHRASGEPIGDSGLYHLPDGARVELGFRFKREFWGRGYAVEVGRAWIRRFDETMPGRTLFADVHPDHHRSRRVLEKLGFRLSHSELVHGMTMQIFVREARHQPVPCVSGGGMSPNTGP